MAVPGPPELGRGVLLHPGQPVPPPWDGAPEISVDDATIDDPAATVHALHEAWAGRRPVVVRMAVDPARFRAPESIVAEPFTLEPDLDLFLDRLHFLVWANTYDGRNGDLVWWWASKAQRLGAALVGGGPGDVVVPDGPAAWIDGGPRAPFPARVGGAAVVHAETVDLGRLTTVPPPRAPRADLAADQLAAVAHTRGPARVIAPAGSGKTRVLTERLRHLISDRGYERSAVLAVAYNVKARDEMVERCADFQPRVQTLNGLGYEVVREALGATPRVLDEREVRSLVQSLLPRRPSRRANTDPIAPYLEALTTVRLGLRTPDDVETWRDDVPGFAALFRPYRERLAALGAVDFDEQIYRAVEVLLADGDLRRRLQARCRHLLVDEFQDLTPAHVLLVRLLAAPRFDVFGVGDDDQVIYGHAGADPRFLVGFDALFPGAHHHALEVNYRCPAEVVERAATLLEHNRRRVPKAIHPGPDASPGPDRLTVRREEPSRLADALRDVVQGWLASGVAPGDIAVLTRVNSLLLAPQVALTEAQVPLATGLGPDVLQRLGVRAALAYLRLATTSERMAKADLVEVYRRPSRGLPEWIQKWFHDGTDTDGLRRAADRIDDLKVADKLEALAADLDLLASVAARRGTARDVLLAVRDDVGLGAAMDQLDRSKGGEGSSQLDDLEALLQVAGLHPDPASFGPWLHDALRRPSATSGVTLATIHKVKGREWPYVVLFGASAGILPHRLAADVEEERRVLHVGITRCRERVVLLADATRPSPLLEQLYRPPGPPEPVVPRPRRRAGEAPDADPVFEALRAWRLERARADGVAPFIVFPDKVLRALAEARPQQPRDLLRVDGIGAVKRDRYGDEVLAVLKEFGSS
jgi:DNA helicase II / ATP-dependent DNA helicase PcrA